MFDVFGDEIVYHGKTVAKFLPDTLASLREDVKSQLQGLVTEDEISNQVNEAEEEAYIEGWNECKKRYDDLLDELGLNIPSDKEIEEI